MLFHYRDIGKFAHEPSLWYQGASFNAQQGARSSTDLPSLTPPAWVSRFAGHSHAHMCKSHASSNMCQCLHYTVKTFGLLQPYFGSSQLHACCVCDTLQTSRCASNLIESLSVVETLLLFVKLGSSEPLAIWLHSYHNHATKELLQGWMRTNKETPNLTRNANL